MQAHLDAKALLQSGYEREADGTLGKNLCEGAAEGSASATCAPRLDGQKGSGELLSVVDVYGREIAIMPRAYVEQFNLLIPAIGVLVHNKKGQVYVHQVGSLPVHTLFVHARVAAGSEALPEASIRPRNPAPAALFVHARDYTYTRATLQPRL